MIYWWSFSIQMLFIVFLPFRRSFTKYRNNLKKNSMLKLFHVYFAFKFFHKQTFIINSVKYPFPQNPLSNFWDLLSCQVVENFYNFNIISWISFGRSRGISWELCYSLLWKLCLQYLKQKVLTTSILLTMEFILTLFLPS